MTAAVLFVVASFSQAAALQGCVTRWTKPSLHYDEPPSLRALRDCQEKAMQKYLAEHPELSDEAFERVDGRQREEVREYLERHPDRAAMDAPAEEAEEADEADEADEAPPQPPKKAGSKDLIDQHELDELEKRVRSQGDGKNGLTPAMAAEIRAFLLKNQGGESGEMADLLSSLERDGGKLTDATILKLKRASRDVDGHGLELKGVDQKTKDWLLDPETDPKADLPGIPSN